VVVGGSLAKPEIVANEVVRLVDDTERFCYHRAADMRPAEAARWIARVRGQALAAARQALAPLLAQGVEVCALVAKEGAAASLEDALASHPRLHAAEGRFYRDVLCEASPIPVRVIPPAALDASKVGKLAAPPWGRDQKLAALAAWEVLAS